MSTWTLNMRQVLTGIATAILLVLVAFWYGSCGKTTREGEYAQQMKQWKMERAALLRANDSARVANVKLKAVVDSAEALTRVQSTKIVALSEKANRFRTISDSIRASLNGTLPDTCDAALALADRYRVEGDTLRIALRVAGERDSTQKVVISSLTLSNANLTTLNERMAKQLRILPEYMPKKFLGFIPLPSRSTSFLVGVLAGVGTAIVVSR